jgi:GDPmannose 4,6-dehydratase
VKLLDWQGKNVLITGVSGFVGSYLAQHLLEKGANVYGLVRRRANGTIPKNLIDRGVFNEVNLLKGDITDISSLASILDQAKPDYVFHLASQSFVPRSFTNPVETYLVNTIGTANLLEAIRMKGINSRFIFAGSSEEYGLAFHSEDHYRKIKEKYGAIFPEPERLPELPVREENPLRPMSPYAVSKVHGDYMVRNYYHCFGLDAIVSRAFNHEGAGRGIMYVTSSITNQVMQLKCGETDSITVGNVSAFRDWTHVRDIVRGYCLLAEKGKSGEVYNQGSERTNSVLTFLLLSLECAGYIVEGVETFNGRIKIASPTEEDELPLFGFSFKKTKVDRLLLEGSLSFDQKDQGLWVLTDKGKISVLFDPAKFRPAEVPILLCDASKIKALGQRVKHSLRDIIRDQLNYYFDEKNRRVWLSLQ